MNRSIRVATWNLWWRFGSWRERADAIRSVLRETTPDICGLQEVWAEGGQNLAAELADELEMHWDWVGSPQP
jgi:endonuclease/exonuclease/phosphatase family metal-dependent hydrolase